MFILRGMKRRPGFDRINIHRGCPESSPPSARQPRQSRDLETIALCRFTLIRFNNFHPELPWSLLIPSCHLFSAPGAESLHWTSLLAVGILRHPGREWKNRGGGEGGEEGSIRFDEIRKPSALKGAHFRGSVNFVPVDVYVFLKKKKSYTNHLTKKKYTQNKRTNPHISSSIFQYLLEKHSA